nr:manganese catalase family protein [Rhodococcus opacus]
MFRHTDYLQFDVQPEKPDPVYARKLQELLGGAFGEMTVTMQYLFQGWNCRMEGNYKDLIMDIATEEIWHVEMIASMVARLLEGAPATESTKAAAADPVVAAVLGGMDPEQAIVAGGGAVLADSNGVPWNGRYIIASGNLLADFRANVTAESQGRLQTARLYNMTDDPGVKDMLKFNLARDTYHQNMWLAAIEQLKADGLEGPSPECPARRGIQRARWIVVAFVRRHRLRSGTVGDGHRTGRRPHALVPSRPTTVGRQGVRTRTGSEALRHLRRQQRHTARCQTGHGRWASSARSRTPSTLTSPEPGGTSDMDAVDEIGSVGTTLRGVRQSGGVEPGGFPRRPSRGPAQASGGVSGCALWYAVVAQLRHKVSSLKAQPSICAAA